MCHGGQVGRGFYYKREERNLYLRYAVFDVGNLTALVSSTNSLDSLTKLLSKPKPLLINRCCGFKVRKTKFQFIKSAGKSHFQISHDQGKTYCDYKVGSNKEIDLIFSNTNISNGEEFTFLISDFIEVMEPFFEITKVTDRFEFT